MLEDRVTHTYNGWARCCCVTQISLIYKLGGRCQVSELRTYVVIVKTQNQLEEKIKIKLNVL